MSAPGNTSSAVRQQRHTGADALDDFPTPPWATRALCEALVARGQRLHLLNAWEPCCNRGHMARPLGEYFDRVLATDAADYGWPGQDRVQDFLVDWDGPARDVDWIVTNPPFRLGCEMVLRALDIARVGVAMFVRVAFDEGADRWEKLFRRRSETLAMPFVERVVIWEGVLLDPDIPVWDAKAGKLRKPSTATAYQWLVWLHADREPTEKARIPPCRARLTRPGDYPPVPAHLLPPEGALFGGSDG